MQILSLLAKCLLKKICHDSTFVVPQPKLKIIMHQKYSVNGKLQKEVEQMIDTAALPLAMHYEYTNDKYHLY